ncbi:MAG: ABC-F family ATP-binding cassette domain-containing protein [Chlamydiae bacterium]|nr:ABC-F family ATP-binding cassette domain-containing protein [Chlamydiota bacterium]
MILLNTDTLSKSFGTKELFKNLNISVFENDRIGLIGQNGSGKSTLLKILSGLEKQDSGSFSTKKGLKIGYLAQSSEFTDKPPYEILIDFLKKDLTTPDYEKDQLVKLWLSKLGFKGNETSALTLSGGWKKRLDLARQMLLSPDLLLLDEPTNHLDLEGIIWLEKFLEKEAPTYLLVSHDRYFLEHATNKIIEIDRTYPNGLLSVNGDYANFLEVKEEFLKGQLQQEKSIASKARREEAWLRSNVKARTTKSEARIDEANELLDTLADIKKRNTFETAKIDFSASERTTRKLLVAKNIGITLNEKTLFKNLDFTLSPGTRIGLMGPNGSGKTTLLKILADELAVSMGTIKRADDLKIVYFDQHRNKLPDTTTLRDALSPTGDFINFHGKPIHVNGWCKRFLFSPDILDLPLKTLSGGERARIAIAHLMLQPADILLLDEPTNDLDIPTLETLEASLIDFPGAVVLITHDRFMLDRICNLFLSLDDISDTFLYADYKQWEASKSPPPPKQIKEPPKPKPISSNKELKIIENKIFKLEEEIKELTNKLQDPLISENADKLNELCKLIGLAETKVEQLYIEWEKLC